MAESRPIPALCQPPRGTENHMVDSGYGSSPDSPQHHGATEPLQKVEVQPQHLNMASRPSEALSSPVSCSTQQCKARATGATAPPSIPASNPAPTTVLSAPSSPVPKPIAIGGMQIFRREIDIPARHHFLDLLDRIQSPLLTYLNKGRVEYRPLALKLMILGHDEQSSKPWLVVLCHKAAEKRVKRFFTKDVAKRLCSGRARGVDDLELIVADALNMKATDGQDHVWAEPMVPVNQNERLPFVGVSQAGQVRIATLGGFVHIAPQHHPSYPHIFHPHPFALDANPTQETSVFGLTAGHLIKMDSPEGANEDELQGSILRNGFGNSSDEDSSAEEETFCKSQILSSPTELSSITSTLTNIHDTQWSSFGYMSKASYSDGARDHDWALIEPLEPSSIGLPNLDPWQHHGVGAIASVGSTRVMIKNGSKQTGHLSNIPALVILPSGRRFAKAWVLTLDDGLVSAGQSGSWVTTLQPYSNGTHEVYGMVIANDIFGEVYVTPMVDIRRDIIEEFKTRDVSFKMLFQSSSYPDCTELVSTNDMRQPRTRRVSHDHSFSQGHGAGVHEEGVVKRRKVTHASAGAQESMTQDASSTANQDERIKVGRTPYTTFSYDGQPRSLLSPSKVDTECASAISFTPGPTSTVADEHIDSEQLLAPTSPMEDTHVTAKESSTSVDTSKQDLGSGGAKYAC